MENKETYQYTYSPAQTAQVEAIRKKYLPQTQTPLERLQALDAIPARRAMVWALSLGILGTLILGTGMSLCMTRLGAVLEEYAMILGIGMGLLGMALAASAYPVYCRVLKKQRQRLAPEILALAQELLP